MAGTSLRKNRLSSKRLHNFSRPQLAGAHQLIHPGTLELTHRIAQSPLQNKRRLLAEPTSRKIMRCKWGINFLKPAIFAAISCSMKQYWYEHLLSSARMWKYSGNLSSSRWTSIDACDRNSDHQYEIKRISGYTCGARTVLMGWRGVQWRWLRALLWVERAIILISVPQLQAAAWCHPFWSELPGSRSRVSYCQRSVFRTVLIEPFLEEKGNAFCYQERENITQPPLSARHRTPFLV